jgi:hypothetical protein
MISDGVNLRLVTDLPETHKNLVDSEEFYPRWVEHPSSTILHHDKNCCEEARLWFLSYARSMEGWTSAQFRMKPPTWLSQLCTWGPSPWPISWCQVFKEKTVDCGVFAALAREIFTAQGFTAHPAQALLTYNENCTEHWKDLWKSGSGKAAKQRDSDFFPWVGNLIVYHEVCVLEMPDGKAKIYDSTFGNWLEPQKRAGFAALLSVRSECPRLLKWGDKILSYGEWVDL